jgi:hypothetical protein
MGIGPIPANAQESRRHRTPSPSNHRAISPVRRCRHQPYGDVNVTYVGAREDRADRNLAVSNISVELEAASARNCVRERSLVAVSDPAPGQVVW